MTVLCRFPESEQQYHVVQLPTGQEGSDWDFGEGQAGLCMGRCMGDAWYGAWVGDVQACVYYLDW